MSETYNLGSAVEESTFISKIWFRDEDDTAISPKTMTWSLQDSKGNYINSREDVSVSDPEDTEYIVLSGDDLAITQATGRRRVLTVKITYDSATYGNDLPIIQSGSFVLNNQLDVP